MEATCFFRNVWKMTWLAVTRRSLHHVNDGFWLALGPFVKHSREPENHQIQGKLHVCSFSDPLISEKRKSTEIFLTKGSFIEALGFKEVKEKLVLLWTASEIKSCHKHLQKHKTTGNSLGQGSAVKERGKKGGQIGKISANDVSRGVDCGAWSQAITK